MLYQYEIQDNNMKKGCSDRGFEIYDHLMSFDLNISSEE